MLPLVWDIGRQYLYQIVFFFFVFLTDYRFDLLFLSHFCLLIFFSFLSFLTLSSATLTSFLSPSFSSPMFLDLAYRVNLDLGYSRLWENRKRKEKKGFTIRTAL